MMSRALTKGVVDADSPCHALLTLDCREDFGRVLECDRSFSKRVHDCEEIDESMRMVSIVTTKFRQTNVTHNTTGPRRAPALAVSGVRSEKAAASRKMAIRGKVMSVNVRRPLVSIRKSVGMVKTTWTAP